MRVLIVEDEPDLADLVARGLRRRGLAVDVALDGADALRKALVTDYEILVLDRDLPAVHGDAVCRTLRAEGVEAKILMLTASGTVRDRVEGLRLGADDYLSKPFAFAELAARIEALGRRSGPVRPPVLRRGDLELDEGRMRVRRAGRPIELNVKEFGVLRTLMAADGGVVSGEELLRRVWDEHADPFTNTVRMTVMRLRRKLGEPDPIETVVGAGYRLP
ncbi:MAG TPA: response regulator transcription factor [Capillimicrobium sp.]|nr:response regulator transcription factor [Capillimicrobium sp.]